MKIMETAAEGLRKTYRVTVEAADITTAMDAELKTLGARVKIPGFRPGHVPMKVLKQRYGKGVESDVIKTVVNDATRKVIEGNKLKLALTPDVKVEEYPENGDLTFTLTADTMPDVPEIAFDSITVDREVFTVEDDAVNDALESLSKANPKPVELDAKTKAENGHLATIDFKGFVNDEAFQGGEAQDFGLVLGSNRLIPGFEEQIVGMKTGDKKTIDVNFPENYFSKDLAGKPAKFDITLKSLSRLDAAPVDDEFAKERGLENLAALKEAVRDSLKREYDNIVRTHMKKRLFDALEGKCTYALPQGMVDMEFNAIWRRLQEAKQQDPDVYEGKSEEDVRAEYQKIAERRVRLGLLLAEIGQKQKIEVSKDELTRALMDHARQFPGQEKAVFDFYRKNPQRLDELRGPILEEKAVDWILERVKLADKKVTTKELAEARDELEGGMDEGAPKESAKKAAPKKKAASKKKGEE